jgi:hypothetical protein
METVVQLFLKRHLSQKQTERAMAFVQAPETFRFRPWEEAFLRAVLIDKIPLEKAEAKFKLPSRSAKAFIARLMEMAMDDVRPCAPLPEGAEDIVEDYSDLLQREAPNDVQTVVDLLGLGPLQARFILVLDAAKGRMVHKDRMMQALYGERNHDDTPSTRIIDSVVCATRKKISGTGLRIDRRDGGFVLIGDLRKARPPAFRPAPVAEVRPPVDLGTDPDQLNHICGLDTVQILTLAAEFSLSPSEARILAVLKNAIVNPTPWNYVLAALDYKRRGEIASKGSVMVALCRLRKKLKPFGGSIRCLGNSCHTDGAIVLNWPKEAWE